MAAKQRRPVSVEEKQLIIHLHSNGKKTSEIVDTVGRSPSVVKRIVAHFKQSGSVAAAPKSGRPRITTAQQDRLIVKMSLKDRFNTAAKISRELKQRSIVQASRQTVTRRLHASGLQSRVPARKPLISKKNQKLRLAFAQEHVVWTTENWSRVHFSDESKFNVIGSDGNTYVRRRTGERLEVKCVKKTVKFGGGSVMVWGVMSAAGCGLLIRLQGGINAEVYKQILRQHAVPSLRSSLYQPAIFMQDNAPCHTAKKVKTFLDEEEVETMRWPPQSPDLNPIENIWKIVGERAQFQCPKNQEELWQCLHAEWSAITPAFCKKLVDSCAKRCQ